MDVPDMYRCVDVGNKAVCDKMTYSMYLRTVLIFERGLQAQLMTLKCGFRRDVIIH